MSMKKRNRSLKVVIGLAVVCLIAAVAVWATGSPVPSVQTGTPFGIYTFERVMEVDGQTVRFYESGTRDYRFCHDADYFLLIRDEDSLTYATEQNGRPVSSGVSVTADPQVIERVDKMTFDQVDFVRNPDLLIEEIAPVRSEPLLSSAATPVTVVNLTILIVFRDDSNILTDHGFIDVFTGETNSLGDYYDVMSQGSLKVETLFPYRDGQLFVYTAPNARSYYNVGEGSPVRAERESELLGGAVKAAEPYLSVAGYDLDIDNDGEIDSVNFLIGGDSSTSWGGLLWPHSSNLKDMSTEDPTLKGLYVGPYSFNFLNQLNSGVVCHEFGHVLGAPDLYHYNKDYVPVGVWDLMAINADVPQYMTTYMRQKYIGGISGAQIATVAHNGVYRLSPVSQVSESGVLAYKIPTERNNEYLMVEYRTRTEGGGYDASLPGSGLLVYRIREGVYGNSNAQYRSSSKPDELYVYRPSVGGSLSGVYNKSLTDQQRANLSVANSVFSSVGTTSGTAKWDQSNLYYSDGTNTGIVIEVLSESPSSIEFSVRLNGKDNISNDYFKNKISVGDALLETDRYVGLEAGLSFGEIEPSYLGGLRVTLTDGDGNQIAESAINIGVFQERYLAGERFFRCPFVVNDKGNLLDRLFAGGLIEGSNVPKRIVVYAVDADGDVAVVATKELALTETEWVPFVQAAKTASMSVAAGERLTLAIGTDGKPLVSGNRTDGQWAVGAYRNVAAGAVGDTHTLLLLDNLSVVAVGSNVYGEGDVSAWKNIRTVAAGRYTSYGVDLSGKVFATGLNDAGQCEVAAWEGIVGISAGARYVVGVTYAGNVVFAGDVPDGVLSGTYQNVVMAAAGETFVAFLYRDGSVGIADTDGYRLLEQMEGVVKIDAGDSHLLGLRADGTVVGRGTGNNLGGEQDVGDLRGVIDLAAGATHSAFLRSDGMVEYRGDGGAYNATTAFGSLLGSAYVAPTHVTAYVAQTEFYVGDTGKVVFTVLPTDASMRIVTFETDIPDCIRFLSDGTFEVLEGAGAVTITVRVYGSDVTERLHVVLKRKIPAEGYRFADAEKWMMLGSDAKLDVVAIPEDADPWQSITFTSDDPSVVTVDKDGKLTGYKQGSATVRAVIVAENGEKFETSCTVTVDAGIESVELITVPQKTRYGYGEALDLTGGMLKIVGKNGQEIEQTLTADAIVAGSFNPAYVGVQEVRIEYYGVAGGSFTVEVFNDPLSAQWAQLPQNTYLYGEAPDLSAGILAVTYADGTTEEVPAARGTLVDADGEGVDLFRTLGSIATWLIYTENGVSVSVAFTADVKDYAVATELSDLKKTLRYGESFGEADTVSLRMASGLMRSVEISELTVKGYDPMVIGTQIVTFEYFEVRNGQTVSAKTTVQTVLRGGLLVTGGDDEGVFWYPLGTSPELTVLIADEIGVTVVGDDPAAAVYYRISGFEPCLGAGKATVEVFVNRTTTTESGSTVATEAFAAATIAVYGVDPAAFAGTLEGDTEYLYGETPRLVLRVAGQPDQPVDPAALIYDPELVDGYQSVRFPYLNRELEIEVIFYDYVVRAEAEGTATYRYGEVADPQNIRLIWAKEGSMPVVQPYELLVDTTRVGAGTGVFRFNGKTADGNPLELQFSVFVEDIVDGISVLSAPRLTYRYGEAFDPASSYTVQYRSGASETIPFSAEAFEYGPDPVVTAVGVEQFVSFVYKATGTTWKWKVIYSDYISFLAVSESSIKAIYSYGEAFRPRVYAHYASSPESGVELSAAQYTVTGYRADVVGKHRVVISAADVTLELTVEVADGVSSATIDQGLIYTDYSYGQAINWSGMQITITYYSGKTEQYKGNAIGTAFDSTYSPTRTGTQTVRLTKGDAEVRFNVAVAKETSSTLTFAEGQGASLLRNKNAVVTERSMTAAELMSLFKVASYLKISCAQAADELVTGGSELTIDNTAGQRVYTFRVYLKGDADFSGTFDSDDVGALAEAMVAGKAEPVVSDYDGDGVVSLTDFYKWVRKAAEQKKMPLNEIARNLIAVRLKEEGEQ